MTEPVFLHDAEQTLEAAQPKRYAAYPAYKPSGVDWLGDVPEHWEIRRLKNGGRLVGGAGFPHEYQGVDAGELPFYKVGDLVSSSDGKFMGTPSNMVTREIARQLRATIVPAMSVVYAKIGAALLLNRRRMTITDCCIDNNMTAFIPSAIFPHWAFYWLNVIDFAQCANPGAVPSFSEGDQKILPLLIPPIAEQQAIARFLGEQTKKIDDLIEAKRDLVALLKEKRQAVISHAVTKGLNPDARLKPSGVDWLGDVPEHWRMTRLGRYTKWSSGEFISNDDYESETSDEHPIPVIGGNGVMGWTDRPLTEHETIVVGRVGALCGNVHFVQSPAWISDNALRLVWHKDLHLPFLFVLLEFLDINRFSAQTAQPLVTGSLLRSLEVPLPPGGEQEAIATYLREVLPPYESLQEEAEAAIGMLGELRSAVISAAVTGKIDVRGGAA